MRVRFGILAVVLVAALTGCGGDDDTKEPTSGTPASSTPSSSSTPSESTDPDAGPVPCAEFLVGQATALQLGAKLVPGTDVSDDIAAARDEFDALKAGSPEEIQRALDEVKAAFTELADAYKSATPDAEKVAVLNSRLAENAQKLDDYITQNCK